MYCGTRRLYFVFSQSICSFRAFNDLWKHQKHMKVNVSNAFHILFCLKTEYLRFFLLERIRRPCLNPLNTFAMPRNDWKNMKSIKPTKKTWKTCTFNASIKKMTINEKIKFLCVFLLEGIRRPFFKPPYTLTLSVSGGIWRGWRVYGWTWVYTADFEGIRPKSWVYPAAD